MDWKPNCRCLQEENPSRSAKYKVPSLKNCTSQKARMCSEDTNVHLLCKGQHYPFRNNLTHRYLLTCWLSQWQSLWGPRVQDILWQPRTGVMGNPVQGNDHSQSFCVLPQYKFTTTSQEPNREHLKLRSSFSSLFFYPPSHLWWQHSMKPPTVLNSHGTGSLPGL